MLHKMEKIITIRSYSVLLDLPIFEFVKKLFAADSVLLKLHLCCWVRAFKLGKLVVFCDFSCLHLELLQTVHFVIEELFDSPGIYAFKLVEDAENHVEFVLRNTRLSKHALHLTQTNLAILPLTFAVFDKLSEQVLVFFEVKCYVVHVIGFGNSSHSMICEDNFTFSLSYCFKFLWKLRGS